jgi:type IV secretory pathway VirJ component
MLLAGVLAAGSFQGCMVSRAISHAAGSAAKSVSDASRSSSERLTSDARDAQRYRDDMRLATRERVAARSALEELQRELGHVAELHGVVHWEATPHVSQAIGTGACEAGASAAEIDALLEAMGVAMAPAKGVAEGDTECGAAP